MICPGLIFRVAARTMDSYLCFVILGIEPPLITIDTFQRGCGRDRDMGVPNCERLRFPDHLVRVLVIPQPDEFRMR